jgi:hypothetical protein
MSEFFLAEPPTGPIAAPPVSAPVAPLRQLGGIDWEGIASEARGLAPLIEVETGEGERQAWEARGAR